MTAIEIGKQVKSIKDNKIFLQYQIGEFLDDESFKRDPQAALLKRESLEQIDQSLFELDHSGFLP